MKKSACILAFAALFALAGCGGGRAQNGLSALPETQEVSPQEQADKELPETHDVSPQEGTEGTLPQESPVPQRAEYILVKADGLNVRAGAGTGYAALGQAQKGVLLRCDGLQNGWLKTCWRGKTAYVSANEAYTCAEYLDKGSEAAERVIEEGLSLIGTPYVYGAARFHDGEGHLLKGFSAERFDCSSLMQYIFYRGAGLLLGVTTRTQVLQGEEVPRGKIQRGDLLFFTNASRRNNTGIERVGHVALYLGGNYILHTASDFAKAEQISPARWENFITARRVIDLVGS